MPGVDHQAGEGFAHVGATTKDSLEMVDGVKGQVENLSVGQVTLSTENR